MVEKASSTETHLGELTVEEDQRQRTNLNAPLEEEMSTRNEEFSRPAETLLGATIA
jgi:hypothetical protein